MKKLLIILAAVAVALALSGFVASRFLGRAVVTAVNVFAPPLTGTPVTLGGAHVSPLTGHGTLLDLFVGNPPGYHANKALSVGRIDVGVEPLSLLRDTIVVEDVRVERPEFVYETNFRTSNLDTILDHLNKPDAGGSGPNAAPKPKSARKYLIKHIVIADATVRLAFGGRTISVPVSKIELANIGTTQNGVGPQEAAAIVMRQVLADVSRSAVEAIAKDGLDVGGKAGSLGRRLGDALHKLFGGKDKSDGQ